MKKAILFVSVGTSHLEPLEQSIGAIEKYCGNVFPNHQIYRAFTSKMIVKKIKEQSGVSVQNLGQVMERMKIEGVEQLIVQPTYVVHSMEYEKLQEELTVYKKQFQNICVGRPLLTWPEDYKACVHSMIDEWNLTRDEIIVIAGHGTLNYAQSAYTMLEYMFHTLGYTNVLVGTVSGFPDVNNVMAKLALMEKIPVRIIPFMIVSGEHVKRDLTDEKAGWVAKFTNLGFETQVVNHGLGEMEGIQRIFAEHIREAMES